MERRPLENNTKWFYPMTPRRLLSFSIFVFTISSNFTFLADFSNFEWQIISKTLIQESMKPWRWNKSDHFFVIFEFIASNAEYLLNQSLFSFGPNFSTTCITFPAKLPTHLGNLKSFEFFEICKLSERNVFCNFVIQICLVTLTFGFASEVRWWQAGVGNLGK